METQTTPAQRHGSTHELIHNQIVAWLRREVGSDIRHIDYAESLFGLGVDSLGAATIAAEVERLTDKTLNPEVVIELETINELADYVDGLPLKTNRPPQGPPHPAGAADVARAGIPCPEQTLSLLDQFARLNRRVESLQEQGRYFFEPEISAHDGAWVVANGKRMLMLGSYEYLGLLGHPHLMRSAVEAIEQFGTGHHGARLLAGTTTIHRRLERKLADFMQSEDAVVFSSGFVTNLATISALVGRGDHVIGDQWNHASIVDGCRMSGAEFLEFRHNDMAALEEQLARTNGRRTLVVVDAVFSMDGDIIDLPSVVELCRRHEALLMVDEAHSLGVLGCRGRGVLEHFGLEPDAVDIKMGTLSKTLAGSGGFVAGSRRLTTYLRHHARGYIFSGALPAGQAAASIAALEILEREPELVSRLWHNVERYVSGLRGLGFDTGNSATPIVPVMTRDDDTTLEMTRRCRDKGVLVIPVCFPAVPADAPRLRTCVTAAHGDGDIDFALDVLADAGRATGLID